MKTQTKAKDEKQYKTHIYDWLDKAENKDHVAYKFFENFVSIRSDHEYTSRVIVTCKYKGKNYRCVGASRLGDIWLHSNMSKTTGYEKRVAIDDCYDWHVADKGQNENENICSL